MSRPVASASAHHRVDVDALRASVDLAEVVGRYVRLKPNGREFHGLCPFHDERTPSFTVNPAKGFVHCFGCGAHHDAVGFVMRIANVDFLAACEQLGHREYAPAAPVAKVAAKPQVRDVVWVPLLPVPEDAPPLLGEDGWTLGIWNQNKTRNGKHVPGFSRMRPARADAYLDEKGRLLGYVLRIEFDDGKKITPTVTWCVGPDGVQQWCMRRFPSPRPLYGLDALALKPDAPVLIPEGEKCRAAGAGALPPYAVVSWPGGSKGIGYVDWRPLRGRDVVLWPDADKAGREAMLGWIDHSGVLHRGVAQHLHAIGVRSLRMVDPDGMPKGWDLADALDPDRDGWSPRQLAAWASTRVVDLDVQVEPRRCAR
jgi:hypothetical protein